MIIVHISGVQGSGKLYICSKLMNTICIDTDDLMLEAKNDIDDSQNTKNK